MTGKSVPAYLLHKGTGQAVVRLSGKDFYLGLHGTPESHELYHLRVKEWLANGGVRPPGSSIGTTVAEVILAYVQHSSEYYRNELGEQTSEHKGVVESVRPLNRLMGRMLASEIGPAQLKALRAEMIDSGLSRKVINQRIGRIKRMFAWAGEEELIDPVVSHRLSVVKGLRRGRSAAKETSPVEPVTEAEIDAVLHRLPPPVRAMVQVQYLAGMRPQEVVQMRTCDLKMAGDVWVYTPAHHKTQHHGHVRQIALGPKAQEVLRPWIRADLQAPLFSPREEIERVRALASASRKTKVQPSQMNRARKAAPKRQPGEQYSTAAYRRAIHRACDAAGIPKWGPHKLRHARATMLEARFDIDTSRAVLGHSTADTTTIYVRRDLRVAIEVAREVG